VTAFAFIRPDTARNVLLILLGGAYLGYHALRWWRRRPKAVGKKVREKVKVDGQGQEENGEEKKSKCEVEVESKFKVEVEERNLTSGAASPLNGALGERALPAGQHNHPQPSASTSSLSGEELFDQARALPHQQIPDFGVDGEYLGLLGRSAAKGYAPALAKLGEYAMRRAAWVEAYYWMKLAQRSGMHGLSPTLREIRKCWSLDGFPIQSSNVNKLFTREAGSIGRALLHVDSGQDAAKAKEFLKASHPEFVT